MIRMKTNKKKRMHKIPILMLVFVLLVTGWTGCGTSEQKESLEPGTILSETKESVEIVDMAGRDVTVAKDAKKYAFVYRVVARFLISLGKGNQIVGEGKPEDFLTLISPNLANVPSIGQGVVDMEALAKVSPDVFFHKANDVQTLDAVEKLGIPAVGLSFETQDEMLTSLKILGVVCGEEKKADALIAYYNKQIADQKNRISQLSDNEKKTAIMMGTTIGKVADGSMLQSKMIESAGAVNPAKNVEATELWPTVGVEEIFQWNPDYIFITNSQSATYTVEDLLSDPAWSAMKAVKNKHIFVMPATEDSWEFPGVVSVLGIDYMMRTMYPDLMTDKELTSRVNRFYELSYGIHLTRAQLGY
jgi:iron complex transport system substrate-binding protein